jgi:hypothetical protein
MSKYSIFTLATDENIFVDAIEAQAGMVQHVEGILARAFVGAREIGAEDIMDEIGAELDAIDQWTAAVDYCDDMEIDTTDAAAFMSELFA